MQILHMHLYSALAGESNKPKFAEFRLENKGLQWHNFSSLGLKLPMIWMHKFFCRSISGWRVLHTEKVYRVAIPTVPNTRYIIYILRIAEWKQFWRNCMIHTTIKKNFYFRLRSRNMRKVIQTTRNKHERIVLNQSVHWGTVPATIEAKNTY